MLNREAGRRKSLHWDGFGEMTQDSYVWIHQFGAYSVCRSNSGVQFVRTIPPVCWGRLIPEDQWGSASGEVFLGPAGELISELTWLSGEPEEPQILRTVGEFEDDLAGWRGWPAVYVPKEVFDQHTT